MYLSYIAEQAGGFACMGRDNKLYIKTISNTVAEVVPFRLFQKYSWGEEFKVSRVAYEDGTRDFKFGNTNYNTIWINQDNMYIVDEEQIQNIYHSCENFTCWSFEGTSIINPALDLGDIIEIDGRKVVYQGKIEYKGKFKADISSKIQAKSKEDSMVTKTSTANRIRRIQSTIDQVEGKMEIMATEVEDNSSKLAQIELDIDEISQRVENNVGLTRTVKGIKTLTIKDAVEGSPLELHIYGNNEVFEQLTLSDSLYIADTTILGGDSNIKINSKVYNLGIEDVLRQYNGVYDEFVYDYKAGTAKVIRRVGITSSGSLYKLSSEKIENLIMPNFELQEGTNTITIPNYSANMEITYIIKNDYTDVFATKVEMNSNISQTAEEIKSEVDKNITTAKGELEKSISTVSQTADNINSEVKKKVGKTEIISTINQSAESVKIDANKIELTGVVKATDLQNAGSTIINGANITTGMISSDRIDTTNLRLGGSNANTEISAHSIEWLTGKVPSPSRTKFKSNCVFWNV